MKLCMARIQKCQWKRHIASSVKKNTKYKRIPQPEGTEGKIKNTHVYHPGIVQTRESFHVWVGKPKNVWTVYYRLWSATYGKRFHAGTPTRKRFTAQENAYGGVSNKLFSLYATMEKWSIDGYPDASFPFPSRYNESTLLGMQRCLRARWPYAIESQTGVRWSFDTYKIFWTRSVLMFFFAPRRLFF